MSKRDSLFLVVLISRTVQPMHLNGTKIDILINVSRAKNGRRKRCKFLLNIVNIQKRVFVFSGMHFRKIERKSYMSESVCYKCL